LVFSVCLTPAVGTEAIESSESGANVRVSSVASMTAASAAAATAAAMS